MHRFPTILVSALAFLIAALAPLSDAAAAVRAFRSSGTAHFTGPGTFEGSGNATHLGRYTEAGTLSLAPTADPVVLAITGSIIYTAASGAELHATASGTLNVATGAISATLTYTGGTGRFDGASGSSTLTGQLDLAGTITVSVRGSIDF